MESTPKRHSAAEWAGLVAEQARSGQTIAHFCQSRNLVKATFMYWRTKLARATEQPEQQAAPSEGFVTIVPRPKAPSGNIVLRGRCGVEAEVPPGTPLDTLQALITALSC